MKSKLKKILMPIILRRIDLFNSYAFLFKKKEGYHNSEYLTTYFMLFCVFFLRNFIKCLGLAKLSDNPVIIVGPHRSGTSLCARVLERNGLFLGRHCFNMGRQNGYGENRLIIIINDYLLRKNGLQYLDLFHKPVKYSKLDMLFFKTIIRYEFVGNYLNWGFKDPRNSLTLDFWLSLFPKARVLEISRGEKSHVSSTMKHFNGMDEGEARILIEIYTKALRTSLSGRKKMTISYEEMTGKELHIHIKKLVESFGMKFDSRSLDEIKYKS